MSTIEILQNILVIQLIADVSRMKCCVEKMDLLVRISSLAYKSRERYSFSVNLQTLPTYSRTKLRVLLHLIVMERIVHFQNLLWMI